MQKISGMILTSNTQYIRQMHNILMFQGKPEGGKWNYDADNRKFSKQKLLIPNDR